MVFDARQWLRDNNIEYVETGPNVAKGNINIACPWCGPSDPSHHLGINLTTLQYGCWRNPDHRGGRIERLLVQLGGISYSSAASLVGRGEVLLSSFEKTIEELKHNKLKTTQHNKLKMIPEYKQVAMPLEFKPVSPPEKMPKPYLSYMGHRGFRPSEMSLLARWYNLQYCYKGEWKDRIIFPVYHDDKLVTWTGRSIHKNHPLRYMSATTGTNIKDTVWNHDWFTRVKVSETKYPKILFICEGPFDALKIDCFSTNNCCAVALYNNNLSENQKLIIQGSIIRNKAPRVVILLDKGELQNSLRIQNQIDYNGCHIEFLKYKKDPGEFTPDEVKALETKWSRHVD